MNHAHSELSLTVNPEESSNLYFNYTSKGFEDRFNGPKLSSEEVLDFAFELTGYFKNKETMSFFKASMPKIKDYFVINGVLVDDDKMIDMVLPDFQAMVDLGLAIYPKKEQIELIPILNGSVVEIVIKPNNDPFLIFEYNSNNKPYRYMRIWVAKIDGHMQIIR